MAEGTPPTASVPDAPSADSAEFSPVVGKKADLSEMDPEATVVAGIAGGLWVSFEEQEDHADIEELDLDEADVVEIGDEFVGTALGSYRLLDLLGEGGMGKVYLAEHVKIGRKVAIKLLRQQYASRHDIVTRFFQEARAVNQIRHENIIDITDFVEDEKQYSYLVMELLTGVDLAELIRRESSLPIERVLHIFVQICDGLAAAHEVGVIHRDLKPDNVFLVERAGRRDFVKLVDFGVAKLLGDAMSADYGAGGVIGTPAYMSPEQAAGDAEVDHRADVYATGAMLYRMFTGRTPFRGKTVDDYVRMHLEETPVPPNQVSNTMSTIPAELEAIILRCLEKDPDARYQTMYELRAELDDVLHIAKHPEGQELPMFVMEAADAQAKKKRSTVLWAALAVFVIAAAGVGWYFARSSLRAGDDRAVATFSAAATAEIEESETAEPGAAAAAARPAETLITFASRPLGAEVWRAGHVEGTPLGVTPFQAPFTPADEEAEFVFKLSGYDTLTAGVSLRESTSLDVELAKAKGGKGHRKKGPAAKDPKKVPKKKPPRHLGSHETFDPFGGK